MRRSRRIVPAPMLPITSMLDMFTIILVFLINFLDPDQDSSSTIELPQTVMATKGKGEALLVIARGEVRVGPAGAQRVVPIGGAGMDDEGLESALVTLREALPAESPVLVVAVDKGVAWETASSVLARASAAGFGDFSFVAVKPD
jgi:biopolymer transport protein ExbD